MFLIQYVLENIEMPTKPGVIIVLLLLKTTLSFALQLPPSLLAISNSTLPTLSTDPSRLFPSLYNVSNYVPVPMCGIFQPELRFPASSCLQALQSMGASTQPRTFGERGKANFNVQLPARVVSGEWRVFQSS